MYDLKVPTGVNDEQLRNIQRITDEDLERVYFPGKYKKELKKIWEEMDKMKMKLYYITKTDETSVKTLCIDKRDMCNAWIEWDKIDQSRFTPRLFQKVRDARAYANKNFGKGGCDVRSVVADFTGYIS